MEDLSLAIELAIKAFKEKFGENAKLEDGDEIVFELNNCVLIISLNDGKLEERFIGGKPLRVDHTLKIYESEDE